MIEPALVHAIEDYRMLLDRGYPEKGSLALVGDRYRLSRDQRHLLFRGVSPSADAERRRRRMITLGDISSDDVLGIDAHNVLLTVANYIRGVRVFESDDGVLRDIGGVHGHLGDENLMIRAIGLVAEMAGTTRARHIHVCFDSPLSHSRDHLRTFAQLAEAPEHQDGRWSFHLAPSADAVLLHLPISVVGTSDSALIDRTASKVWDLARRVLSQAFNPRFDTIRP